MSVIPILPPEAVLNADVLEASQWYEYGETTGAYDYQVPPEPHPWAFSAFQRALHFHPGSDPIRLECELRETVPEGEEQLWVGWVYQREPLHPLAQFQAESSDTADRSTLNPAVARWQSRPGWRRLKWRFTTASGDRQVFRIARLSQHQGEAWFTGFMVLRAESVTPELQGMIDAQAHLHL